MMDISALMHALPVSGLVPNCVAFIGGLLDVPENQAWLEKIQYLEPPAGQRVPYVEPVHVLEKLLRRQGMAKDAALVKANALVVEQLKPCTDARRWMRYYDKLQPKSPECLPVPDFVAWLRAANLTEPEIADFLGETAEIAAHKPMFTVGDNRDAAWSLQTLPDVPPPKAMIEFVPAAPWEDMEKLVGANAPFQAWRECIRPVTEALEKALGEPVYYFADPQDDCDDDAAHRFLLLHWCCTWKLESGFVKYLLAASGASDVETLKAALINPANYTQPFAMNDPFCNGIETCPCQFEYLPASLRGEED
jgi:hypothetical protein